MVTITPKFVWTLEKIELLQRLAAEGLSCTRIGERMGLTKNAVVGKLNRLRAGQVLPISAPPEDLLSIGPSQEEMSKPWAPRRRANFGTILIHRHNKFKPGADAIYAELAQAAANTLKMQKKLSREAK